MVMLSLYLNKEIPFTTIYLHGLILDEHGKKMSKSKGTGIDPLPIADKYGMDALRMSLIIGNAPGQDFRMYEKKIEGYRNFANKLWNIARYILATPETSAKKTEPSLADRWIQYRLNETVGLVTKKGIEKYDFSSAGQALYSFLWHDLADWYLEASKVSPNPKVLRDVFITSLKLLHPFMPFITEQIWSYFSQDGLLMIASWPKTKKMAASESVQTFETIRQVVVALRNFKAHSLLPADVVGEYVGSLPENYIAGLSRIRVRHVDQLRVSADVAPIALGGIRFQFPTAVVKNYEAWRVKEREQLQAYIRGQEKKLSNDQFVTHARAEVVDQERQKLAEAQERLVLL
jgi:valyl-tRNA synthetase